MIFDSECHTAGKAGKATHAPKVHREPLFVPKVFDAARRIETTPSDATMQEFVEQRKMETLFPV